MAVLTEKNLDEIIDYLEKSMQTLAKNTRDNAEFSTNREELEMFLSNQFDIRLDNLLKAKSSGIHHLESKLKNKTIQRKQEILEKLKIQTQI